MLSTVRAALALPNAELKLTDAPSMNPTSRAKVGVMGTESGCQCLYSAPPQPVRRLTSMLDQGGMLAEVVLQTRQFKTHERMEGHDILLGPALDVLLLPAGALISLGIP